jgi:hypothetical protein
VEKVKVSKDQEESIRNATRDYANVATIVRSKSRGEVFPSDYDQLNQLDLDTLIRALYIGYEVEQTPEDKVREFFKEHWDKLVDLVDQQEAKTICVTIYKTLDLLGIKIEGVNDI